ncbi:MAG TPA: DUF6671 family protein [Trichocoleus sp.]|jgi:hypothetical protein
MMEFSEPQANPDRSIRHWFGDRSATLATMHQKERVIAPLLEQSFGLRVTVPAFDTDQFNTDQFGTFTREVKRPGDQILTARLKAQAAMQRTGDTIGIASEGSFAPHPAMPLLPANREIVMLIDRQHDLEVIGEALSTATNFRHQQVRTGAEAQAFAAKVGFPEHGLIVIADPDANGVPKSSSQIVKGITTEEQLTEAIEWALQQAEIVHLETDMRAMYNPMRMKVIAQATQDLITKLQQLCPECGFPGFSIVDRRPGLPCELCLLPTPLTRSVIYRCQKCSQQQEILFPDGCKTADPGQCLYCNP